MSQDRKPGLSTSTRILAMVLLVACIAGLGPAAIRGDGWIARILFVVLLHQFFDKFGKPLIARRLLAWNGWQDPARRNSWAVKLWGIALKVFIPKGSSTFSLQDCLPSLPVPQLEDTCEKYLASVKPLVGEEKWNEVAIKVKEFQSLPQVTRAHHALVKKSKKERNWIADWWLDYQYLKSPYALCINYNYFGLDGDACRWNPKMLISAQKRSKNPFEVQTARAASISLAVLEFQELVVNAKLEPLKMGPIPLDMSGFELLVGYCRKPLEEGEGDEFVRFQWNLTKRHVVAVRNGYFFGIPAYHEEDETLLSAVELQEHFKQCIAVADALPPCESAIGVMTTKPRKEWSTFYKKHVISNATNRELVSIIQSAALLVALDTEIPSNVSEYGKQLLCGQPQNRFYDKSFTVIVLPDGQCGFNAEHSYTDATVVGYMWEWILCHEKFTYAKDPRYKLPAPMLMEWEFSEDAKKEIAQTAKGDEAIRQNVDMHIMDTPFGKGLIKKFRMSPDGFIQNAFQLAFFRDQGYTPLTYEPASTRRFIQGRTEVIRSATMYSKEFVNAFEDKNVSDEEKVKLLQRSITNHVKSAKSSSAGLGADRHLFGLKTIMKENGEELPALFEDETFTLPWALSTSQTPTKLTKSWIRSCCIRAGGFGAVTDHGYGLTYLFIADEKISLCITSYRHSGKTDAQRFCHRIIQALQDMRDVVERVQNKTQS